MSRINTDEYGLYVRINGSVYRPYETPWSYYASQAAVQGVTQFKAGEEIKLSHVRCSPFARLRSSDGMADRVELWHSHGTYYDGSGRASIKSDEIWSPKEQETR